MGTQLKRHRASLAAISAATATATLALSAGVTSAAGQTPTAPRSAAQNAQVTPGSRTAPDLFTAQYPPGCTTFPIDQSRYSLNGWDGNCWVGYAYDNNGTYVAASQLAVQGYFINVGPVDGVYGGQTYNGIVQYQQNNGLAADGVVGGSTWKSLQSHLQFQYPALTEDEYSSGLDPAVRFGRSTLTSGGVQQGVWYVEGGLGRGLMFYP